MSEYRFQVVWADLDANNHMKNTRYLDYAAQSRFCFLSDHGFSPAVFAEHRLGPVVLEDRVKYLRELRHLESFVVSLALQGQNELGSRFILHNTFRNEAGEVCAEVWSHGAWFSVKERKVVAPPPALLAAMADMPRTADFQVL